MTNNTLKYIGVAVVAGLLVVAGYWVKKPTTITYNTDGTKTVLGGVSPALGPWYSVGDVRFFGYSTSAFNNASTTKCSFISPPATSTLMFASAQITTPTTTAIVLEWGKSAFPSATSTSLGYTAVASGIYSTFLASSTSDVSGTTDLGMQSIFAPSQYLTLKVGSAAVGGLLQGVCNAVFFQNS